MRARGAVAVIIFALGASAAPSCKPVQGTPLPSGPVNLCGTGIEDCTSYSIGETAGGTPPSCNKRAPNTLIPQADTQPRCDYGPPTLLYTLVVTVPDSSIYAAGRGFAFKSTPDLLPSSSMPSTNPNCKLPACLPLTTLIEVSGQYSVTGAVANLLGLSTNGTTSIPVQARFIPFGPGTTLEPADLGLPLPDLYTTSGNFSATQGAVPRVIWSTPMAIGTYARIDYPEPPFDAYIPPYFSTLVVAPGFDDNITLGTASEVTAKVATDSIDDESGALRTTTIIRRDGLDGWKVWIAEHTTQRRISTLKTLSGTNDTEVLQTVNFRQTGPVPSLVDNVDLVITPPESYLAVPKLVSAIINGSGFRNIEFPVLPSPVTFSGVVGVNGSDGTPLIGVPANVAFASSAVLKITDGSVTPVSDPTLQYATVVNTDDSGQFSTVLPPGTYDVTVSPIEGTGFSKYQTSIDTRTGLSSTFKPPTRTSVSGRAILADGRLLSYATLRLQAASTAGLTPRPVETLTGEDGTFSFEADQGDYNLTVDPQTGTFFPRVVQPLAITGDTQVLQDVVVPPGARFALTIRDPTSVANPIAHALVRVFAEYPGKGIPAVEIASNTTDTAGYVEISLAPQTR